MKKKWTKLSIHFFLNGNSQENVQKQKESLKKQYDLTVDLIKQGVAWTPEK